MRCVRAMNRWGIVGPSAWGWDLITPRSATPSNLLSSFFLQRLDGPPRQNWPFSFDGQLVELPVNLEPHLVILVVHRSAGVGAACRRSRPLEK